MSESHRQLLATQFPSQSDSLSPPHETDYSRFTIKAPSSSFFPRIPTRRRGSQPSTAGTPPASGNTPSTVVAPSPSLAGSSPTPAPTGPDNVLITPAVIDVDSPDDTLSPSKQSIEDVGTQPFADVPASPPQWAEGQAAQQEEGHPASPSDSPLIEDISGSMFLTDAQQPSEPAIQIPLRLLAHESRAASSAEAVPDVSAASNAQLRILLDQAVAEIQSRWAHSQNQAWALETSVERAWRQCRTAVEPVFGNIPEVPENSRVEEMARLCTRLAEETARWKNYYRDSTQETTALLANSVEEFRVADDRLREVEPAVAAYKGILDNWHTYCDQAYAEEQTGRAQVHQLRVRLQRATSAEQPQIQEQLEQQQQQISALTDRSAQWLLEGRKAQAELQHLVAKITSLQTQNQQLFDTVGLQLEHIVGEPFPTHVQHIKAVAAARVTVSEILGEWQAFQARLKISAPAILSACMGQATDRASQPSSSSHPAPPT